MSTEVHNASAMVSFYRNKGVSLVKTPQGILFFGTRFLKASERETLSKFDQKTLHAVWRRQQ